MASLVQLRALHCYFQVYGTTTFTFVTSYMSTASVVQKRVKLQWSYKLIYIHEHVHVSNDKHKHKHKDVYCAQRFDKLNYTNNDVSCQVFKGWHSSLSEQLKPKLKVTIKVINWICNFSLPSSSVCSFFFSWSIFFLSLSSIFFSDTSLTDLSCF